eukprot:COSAG02_NODE_50700_length_319_cov_0.431818_1_plen_87_part_10
MFHSISQSVLMTQTDFRDRVFLRVGAKNHSNARDVHGCMHTRSPRAASAESRARIHARARDPIRPSSPHAGTAMERTARARAWQGRK